MRLRVWRIHPYGCAPVWRASVLWRGEWFVEYASTRRAASWYAVRTAMRYYHPGAV